MVGGDVIVVRSAFAAGKLLPGTTAHVARIFERLGARVPKGFFVAGSTMEEAVAADEEGGWEWDRSAEEVAEAAARRGATAAAGAGSEDSDSDADADVDVDAI
jgi:hypothetical protein